MTKHVLRTPNLDLPEYFVKQFLDEIDTGIATVSGHSYKSTPDCFTEKIMRYISLWTGEGRVYRLSEELEAKLKHHYREVVDGIPVQCKIRVKSFHGVNWVPIHSDRGPTSPHGDTATLSIGVRTNGEHTHFYDWKGGDFFEASFRNLLSCRQVDTIQIEDTHAYLFNNNQPHSVSGFRPGRARFLLVLSWPGLDYQELKQVYQGIPHDISV